MIQGRMIYRDGSVYEGGWVDGKRRGRGICTFVDGSVYEGEFCEGNFHGTGKLTWSDGGWYLGEWNKGEIYGVGMEIRRDGTIRHDGVWRQGVPIRSPGGGHYHQGASLSLRKSYLSTDNPEIHV
jgi:hypothetical protein